MLFADKLTILVVVFLSAILALFASFACTGAAEAWTPRKALRIIVPIAISQVVFTFALSVVAFIIYTLK